jgi:hypothetical protein
MKLLRLLLTLFVLLILVVATLLWWNLPGRIDMAAYAPADSLIYLEFNSLTDLARAIEQNETWKSLAPVIGSDPRLLNAWSVSAARAGLAPVQSVVFTRAQFALVMIGLTSKEEGDTLRIRPEVALVVETHTANWRIKSDAIEAVKQLANYAYGQSNCVERAADADYVECLSSINDRKLIGAVDGSVVILGNTAKAVQSCLEVRRGIRPGLQTDAELQQLRNSLRSDAALSFGYISSANVAKIFSWAAPLLMGQAPGDRQLEQLLSTSAAKILRAVAWTSRTSPAGIEDRYSFSLEPEVITRLEPAFAAASPTEDFWKFVPQNAPSLTIYQQGNPSTAWVALNSALSFKLDAVSAVMFASLLRTALAVYGIDNPNEFLSKVHAPLVTMRARADDNSSVLLARTSDQSALRQTLENQFKNEMQIVEGLQSEPESSREFAAVLLDGYVLIGKTESVKTWLQAVRAQPGSSRIPARLQKLGRSDNVPVTSYSNDAARVESFISTVALLRRSPLSPQQSDKLRDATKDSAMSITETHLTSTGIERKTRSPFGQISTILSLVQADSSTPSRR